MKKEKKTLDYTYKRKHKGCVYYTQAICAGLAVMLYLLICLVAIAVFSGCVKYVDKEVLVPYEVKVPVPTKCKYAMPKEIIPNTDNLQGMFNSLTEIIARDRELRNSITKIPCIEIIKE